MTSALESLDSFLVHPASGRAVTGLVRRRLAETHPQGTSALLTIDAVGPRIRAGERAWRDSPDGTVAALVRAALRQDPDSLAITRLGAEDVELFVHALLVGTQACLAGVVAPSAPAGREAVLGALDPAIHGHLPQSLHGIVETKAGVVTGVFALTAEGLTPLAWLEDGRYRVAGEAEPAPAAPAAEERELVRWHQPPPPPPSLQPRPAWLARVEGSGSARSRLGATSVLLPEGFAWPACGECGKPLQHLLQLDLAALPAPLRAAEGLAQLFVCTGGCDTLNESAPGTHCRVVTGALVEVSRPEGARAARTMEAGDIVGWERRDEDPSTEDLPRGDDVRWEDVSHPWHCDKLGGWPAWTQGAEWPDCPECAARMELLFSFCDRADFRRAGAPRWDAATATQLPGEPLEVVFDPARPVHFPDVLTADTDAFLFRCPAHPARLAWRWQTG